MNLPQAPIPQLSAVQSADVSVAAATGEAAHPSLPLHSDHLAALHQPTAKSDPDDFGAFQASNSLPMQEGTAATSEFPHTLQPVQLQKPLLSPALASTPPTAPDSTHSAVMAPPSNAGWTTSAPQNVDRVEPLHSSPSVPAQVEASPALLMPSEVGQTSGDRYAAFRDFSTSLNANAPMVGSASKAEDGEQLVDSRYPVYEHKEQGAEATGMFSEVSMYIFTHFYRDIWYEATYMSSIAFHCSKIMVHGNNTKICIYFW